MENKIEKMTSYTMDRDNIGLAIIINNLHFEHPQTQNDVGNLEETFKKIGVKVEKPRLNQDKRELEDLAKQLATPVFGSYNAIFLVIISHGKAGDFIVCSDKKKTFDMHFFVESLCKNKSLVGQPKIILCDFCRGDKLNVGETKSTISTKIPCGSDVFIGHATTKGNYAITGSNSSPFIRTLCDKMQTLYQSAAFQVVFQRVQQEVSELQILTHIKNEEEEGTILNGMQIPESKSTLRKDLFLLKQGKTSLRVNFLNIFTL